MSQGRKVRNRIKQTKKQCKRWYTKKQMEKHLQNYIKPLFPNTIYLFLPDDCIRTLKKKKTFPAISLSHCKNNSLYYDSHSHHALTCECVSIRFVDSNDQYNQYQFPYYLKSKGLSTMYLLHSQGVS
jgi:hypothetical protein